MSFEQNHINPIGINRHNYEECLLLYVDGELTPEEKAAVDTFLLLHPDLQAELDGLMQTKLEPEETTFGDATLLLAHNMKFNVPDESLLLYLDGELSAGEKKKVEDRLQHDEAFRLQYQLLGKTKLDPQEVISCPNKKELYRNTEKRIDVPAWLLMAAAVLLIASMGVFYVNDRSEPQPKVTVAQRTKPTGQPVQTNRQMPQPSEQQEKKVAFIETPSVPEPASEDKIAVVKNEPAKPAIKPQVIRDKKENGSSNFIAVASPPVTPPQQKVTEHAVLAESRKKPVAVPETVPSYVSMERVVETEAVYASEIIDDNRGRSPLKGILRKATRMLERRVNIDATNGDDELLIGAIAIKLK